MWSGHQVTVAEANETLADVDARLFDPDPKSNYGTSARVIGYSPTAVAVLVVILVHREDKPGAWWGANGWRANSTDRRAYREGALERATTQSSSLSRSLPKPTRLLISRCRLQLRRRGRTSRSPWRPACRRRTCMRLRPWPPNSTSRSLRSCGVGCSPDSTPARPSP